jgi:hypothetical protein
VAESTRSKEIVEGRKGIKKKGEKRGRKRKEEDEIK